MKSIPTFFSHLECSACGTIHDHAVLQTLCTRCGKSLFAKYDMDLAKRKLSREMFASGERTLWRYRTMLPVLLEENAISLGEGQTPVIRLRRLGAAIGLENLWLKDEAFNATGSFKARGLCLAVAKARELGARELCAPSAGNAGAALAAYASAAGLVCHVYIPADTPRVNIHECYLYGANVHLVQGVISDAAAMMNHDKTVDWFDVSTLKEPYRVEGKKTLGYEIADQFAWRLPDVIMYPTGGGTGLIGMWKAFQELEALGWIDARRPRMVAVQSTGCAPIVKAFEAHLPQSEFWRDATTIASGIRVPKAFADLLILKVLYESRGTAVAVSDADIIRTIHSLSRSEGLLLCPEGAATIAALELLRVNEEIKGADVILVLNTASALKYVEVLEKVVERAQSAASMTGASA